MLNIMLTLQEHYYQPQVCCPIVFTTFLHAVIILVGTPVHVLISSSKINEISTEGIYLNLLLKDGVVSSNALMHCGSLLSGVIVVSNEPFRY